MFDHNVVCVVCSVMWIGVEVKRQKRQWPRFKNRRVRDMTAITVRKRSKFDLLLSHETTHMFLIRFRYLQSWKQKIRTKILYDSLDHKKYVVREQFLKVIQNLTQCVVKTNGKKEKAWYESQNYENVFWRQKLD